MDKTQFFGGKEASSILGVHQRTLYLWEKKGNKWELKHPIK